MFLLSQRRISINSSLLLLLPLISLLVLVNRTIAAHARKRQGTIKSNLYSSPQDRYDRSITTFNDEGRLLQVEYGQRASCRGGCVACACFDLGALKHDVTERDGSSFSSNCNASGTTNGEELDRVIVIAMARNITQTVNKGTDSNGTNVDAYGSTATKPKNYISKESKLGYQSINDCSSLAFVSNSNCRSNKVHRIDTDVILITTGVNGDGYALADMLRLSALNKRLANGEAILEETADRSGFMNSNNTRNEAFRTNKIPMGASVGVHVLARECAKIQHKLTGLSGARPLGVCATLAGIDPLSGILKLFQSDVSGVAEEYEYCAAGFDSDTLTIGLMELLQKLYQKNSESRSGPDNMNDNSKLQNSNSLPQTKNTVSDDDVLKELIAEIALITFRAAKNERHITTIINDTTDDSTCNHTRTIISTVLDIILIKPNPHGRGQIVLTTAENIREKDLNTIIPLFVSSNKPIKD